MDWTKAKSILIVALVVTNLILIATYFSQNNELKSDEKEMHDVTIKLLRENNIFVETEIPEEHKRMAKLTVQYDTMSEDLIEEQLANQKPKAGSKLSDENLISMTSEFIEKCDLMTENVTFDRIERTREEIRVTYKNYINGIAIEDSYIILTIKNGKIEKLVRYWLNPVEISDTEKDVIPAGAALLRFMSDNTTNQRIVVKDISLVYWLDSGSFDAESPVTDTAFPAWKITYNQDKIEYIPAWEQ